VVVVLPPAGSRLLTRELLYTAVTRSQIRLTIVGSEPAIRAAVDRPIARASGLADERMSASLRRRLDEAAPFAVVPFVWALMRMYAAAAGSPE
jgi:hypothetical protein